MTNYAMPHTQFTLTMYENGRERVYVFQNNAQGWNELEQFKEETGIDLLQDTMAKHPKIRKACHEKMAENPQKTWDLIELVESLSKELLREVANEMLKEAGLPPLP